MRGSMLCYPTRMCFSAPASFVAGAALTATGVITTRAAKRRERAFASIPLLFGIQQLLDGIAWIAIGKSVTATSFAAYGYAFFAYMLWPVLVPFAVLQLEPDKGRRKLLTVILVIGLLTALYALVLMLSGPVTARTLNSCIRYDTAIPYWLPMLIPYMLATVGSCLVSSRRFINWFGLVVLIASGIAGWFYFATFSSVWCFFAAILSGMIYWHVRK